MFLPLDAESYTIDQSQPSVTLTTSVSDPTNSGFIVTVKFSEAVSGLHHDINDDIVVTVNGVAEWCCLSQSGSGDQYGFLVGPSSDGVVTVNLPAAAVMDAVGNSNTAAAPLTRNYDASAPTVTIASSSAANASVVTLDINFNEDVTGFAAEDVVVTNASKGALLGGPSSYTMDITPSADGTITVNVAASVAVDSAGNNNEAAAPFAFESDPDGTDAGAVFIGW